MPSMLECPITAKVNDAINADAEPPRGHLGMSQIAGDARTLWLTFRWSLPDEAAPRTRRIWALGHAIEAELIRYLRDAGFELYADDGGEQFGFSYLGGHFRGSMDGVIRGLPQSTQWHVFEAKSVNGARFKELVKVGVKSWSPVYYGQMQTYGWAANLKRALFAAYNKDTSELYFERVKIEATYGPAMLVKAEEIITGDIPASSYPSRTHYEVKNFRSEAWQRVYWGDELPLPNCRNCRFSVTDVENDGAAWGCKKKRKELTLDEQRKGCLEHNFIPSLVNGEVLQTSSETVTYRMPNGLEITNGPEKFMSHEMSALSRVDYGPELVEAKAELAETFGDGVQIEDAWLVSP